MDRSELIIKINVIKQLGTPIEDLISLIDEQNKEESLFFFEFVRECKNEDFDTFINNNPHGIKSGYYYPEQLYDFYLQSKQITK